MFHTTEKKKEQKGRDARIKKAWEKFNQGEWDEKTVLIKTSVFEEEKTPVWREDLGEISTTIRKCFHLLLGIRPLTTKPRDVIFHFIRQLLSCFVMQSSFPCFRVITILVQSFGHAQTSQNIVVYTLRFPISSHFSTKIGLLGFCQSVKD